MGRVGSQGADMNARFHGVGPVFGGLWRWVGTAIGLAMLWAALAVLGAGASPGEAPSRRVLPALDVLWTDTGTRGPMKSFQEWAGRYARAGAGERPAMVAEGVERATARRLEMRELIQVDPMEALNQSVPRGVRRELPPEVVALLEEPVEGVGDLDVLCETPVPGSAGGRGIVRWTRLGGVRRLAFVYGERLFHPTQASVALHGVALDGMMAVAESPLRRLEAWEQQSLDVHARHGCDVDSADGHEVEGEAITASVGGEVRWVCGTKHLEALHDALVLEATRSESIDAGGAPRLMRAYTEGTKRLIFIRVDFSDLAGTPFTDAMGTNMVAGLDAFFREQSYGKTGFAPMGPAGSAMTATLRMPRTAAYYGSVDPAELRTAARNAATAAGHSLGSYSFDLVCFGAVPGYAWAGLGYVGAPGAWIRASFDAAAGVIAHELGHNFGLSHANFWDTGGASVVGAGTSVEYGDTFDTMGNATGGRRHFNTRYKNYLDWLPSGYVRNAATNGTYRVYAMDSTNGPVTVRALTVRRNSKTNYWVEARQKWTASPWMEAGVGVRWGQTANTATLLLDTTPGSADGKNDAPLVLGRTFSDAVAGVHLTTLAKGGTDPVWYDVGVRLGNATNNQPPKVQVSGSASSLGVNGTLRLTATASDPDDAELAFAWDFGDGTFGTNGPTASKTYGTAGDYQVRCVVSDLRGGTGSGSFVVRVGVPTTIRVSGKVTREGQPVAGARVYTSNTKQTYTDSDGTYALVGLARGTYNLQAQAENLVLSKAGFSNPLNLQADRANLNFEASAPGDLALVTLIPLGAEWMFYDKGSSPSSSWKLSSYDDSFWSRGPAQLGYGDDDVVTVVGYGPNSAFKFVTTWFRHAFTVDDPKAILSATVGLVRDDGAVVYLNGREVFRSNMPTGAITATTLASSTVGGTDESTLYEADLNPSWLVTGRNVMAVELHQSDPASSDLSFALQLTAILTPVKDPVLRTAWAGDQWRLSWPLGAVGFEPETATSAAGPWEVPDGQVDAAGGEYVLRVPVTDAARFYRLRKP